MIITHYGIYLSSWLFVLFERVVWLKLRLKLHCGPIVYNLNPLIACSYLILRTKIVLKYWIHIAVSVWCIWNVVGNFSIQIPIGGCFPYDPWSLDSNRARFQSIDSGPMRMASTNAKRRYLYDILLDVLIRFFTRYQMQYIPVLLHQYEITDSILFYFCTTRSGRRRSFM